MRKRLALDVVLAVEPRHDGSVSDDLRYAFTATVVASELLALVLVPVLLKTVAI